MTDVCGGLHSARQNFFPKNYFFGLTSSQKNRNLTAIVVVVPNSARL